MTVEPRYEFWIDRGGTFTDCIGYDRTTGQLSVLKVLSSDRAPMIGIRRLLGLEPDAPIPPCEVRLGTTLATNALLERKGVRSALAITRGFADLLLIGDQTRPDLFALSIEREPPLPEGVIELDARLAPDGATTVLQPDATELADVLARWGATGIKSLGVVVMHDHAAGVLERPIAEAAARAGFEFVSLSHELSREAGFLARAETTSLDAYLTPLLRTYLAALSKELPGSTLRLMQSSGGLTDAERFRAPNAILSGPAGGVVAAARIAEQAGLSRVIGFDMGGTSTDVSRYGGEYELGYERMIAGVRVRAPSLSVHTVAAGGGSICRFDGTKLSVGPESAGAVPGPLCYGRPEARELTVTDLNLLLGRIVESAFPFPLATDRARAALESLTAEVRAKGYDYSPEALAEGFRAIADLHMAEAIREISVARGYDVRDYALVVFGGAGGQHACGVARRLGIETVVFHPLAGVLSAYGIGLSDVTFHGEREVRGARVRPSSATDLEPLFAELEAEGRRQIGAKARDGALRIARRVDLRYLGTETVLTLPVASFDELAASFDAEQLREFGHDRPDHPIELLAVRVEVGRHRELSTSFEAPASGPPRGPKEHTRLFFGDAWLEQVPVYERSALPRGATLQGPALVTDPTGSIVIEPGFDLDVEPTGLLVLRARGAAAPLVDSSAEERPDPVTLEIMSHAFMAIAEQMGQVLRRTALSTNIRERLDFSCAVFDRHGGLVANAPHIPVHLGAMSESVQAVLREHPELEAGDVYVTNDPARGGSHLPDVTVVAPVHDGDRTLRFFVASRGHHADIGGITPGSMPAFSQSLAEEGVVLSGVRLVHRGKLDREGLFEKLASARFPARRPLENLADLQAQVAAVHVGGELLRRLCDESGLELVERYMQFVQDDAAHRVLEAIQKIGLGEHRFEDALDDGTPIKVRLEVQPERLSIDFSGSGPALTGNLNAPRAVTLAGVLYFLRALVGHKIPLNGGCLRHVSLFVPEGSVLHPPPLCAVAGGNVETSQRVVDVLLGAARALAGSQGTMNNLTFGDETFGYYETICGGAGAGPDFDGASAVHTHMTNTRITDPEILERRFPVRLIEFSVRRGTGGEGRRRGGDGVVREFEFLRPLDVSLLSERRERAPFGLDGGGSGTPGRALLNGKVMPGKFAVRVEPGDRLRIETPGGGGFGRAS